MSLGLRTCWGHRWIRRSCRHLLRERLSPAVLRPAREGPPACGGAAWKGYATRASWITPSAYGDFIQVCGAASCRTDQWSAALPSPVAAPPFQRPLQSYRLLALRGLLPAALLDVDHTVVGARPSKTGHTPIVGRHRRFRGSLAAASFESDACPRRPTADRNPSMQTDPQIDPARVCPFLAPAEIGGGPRLSGFDVCPACADAMWAATLGAVATPIGTHRFLRILGNACVSRASAPEAISRGSSPPALQYLDGNSSRIGCLPRSLAECLSRSFVYPLGFLRLSGREIGCLSRSLARKSMPVPAACLSACPRSRNLLHS